MEVGWENTNCQGHFGLQILEHVARFQWNSVSLREVSLKASIMGLTTGGTLSVLEEENHTEDILCQTMAEVI